MAASKRSGAMLLSAVAIGLSVMGVVLAATDPNPGAMPKDSLVLNGYPPKSANILVKVSTGQSYSLSANVNVDFVHGAVEATLAFPLAVTVASVELRLIDSRLYAGSTEATSGKWLAMSVTTPSLFGYSLELTKPDIALISGFASETITKSGFTTTYTFRRDNVAVANIFGSLPKQVQLGALTWSISTGSQGEVVASAVTIRTKHQVTSFSATVVSYNQSASISVPPVSDVRSVAPSLVRQVLNSTSLDAILLPVNLLSFTSSHLS